ncbi:MAG TPA: hypothetical protein PKE29_07045 [Phycisphaerales bacterium]|nr:hypothetical protein [Phycisphaerales bacterium]
MTPNERSNTGDHGVSTLSEREGAVGWRFDLSLPCEDGEEPRTVTLVLSWVDYEYWSHGIASPCRVAEAVVRALLAADPKRELPDEFDASTARRWVRDLDQRVREML